MTLSGLSVRKTRGKMVTGYPDVFFHQATFQDPVDLYPGQAGTNLRQHLLTGQALYVDQKEPGPVRLPRVKASLQRLGVHPAADEGHVYGQAFHKAVPGTPDSRLRGRFRDGPGFRPPGFTEEGLVQAGKEEGCLPRTNFLADFFHSACFPDHVGRQQPFLDGRQQLLAPGHFFRELAAAHLQGSEDVLDTVLVKHSIKTEENPGEPGAAQLKGPDYQIGAVAVQPGDGLDVFFQIGGEGQLLEPGLPLADIKAVRQELVPLFPQEPAEPAHNQPPCFPNFVPRSTCL